MTNKSKVKMHTIARLKVAIEKIIPNQDDIISGENGYDAFNRSCMLLESLTEDQQNLIINLLENFHFININDHYTLFRALIKKIDFGIFHNYKYISILPCITKKDHEENKYKSGTAIANLFRNFDYATYTKNVVTKAKVYTTPYHYKNKKANDIIIFVDDFIGTGETALTAIEDFFNYHRRKNTNYCIASLISMERGYNAIKSSKHPFFTAKIVKRGISDSVSIDDKKKAIETMLEIEKKINVYPDFSLGYKQSEGLITLTKTPNNTFPVFWETKATGDNPWPAPFPR